MRVIRLPVLALALCLVGSCGGVTARPQTFIPVTGDPVMGRAAIIEQGCGSCHSIPGIPNANSLVGPPLDSWPHRSFIAGTLTNSPDNLALWIAEPQRIRPGSAMPDLELDEDTVADIVAYLFTLD
jgi:cytochrome c